MTRANPLFSRRRLLMTGGALAGATAAFGLLPRAFAGASAEAKRAQAGSGAEAEPGGGAGPGGEAGRRAEAGPGGEAGRRAEAGPGAEVVRRLTLKNLHTPEVLDVVYRRGDRYVPEALAQVDVLLRDYRTGDRHPIDPHLLDILYEVAQGVGVDPVFSVISGYRSPQTNAMLHERSAGVASHSLHMEGRAIDVRLTHVDCAALASKALEMKRGGVGYYRQSDFVHLDNGRIRTWRG
jgi:uncharacterized protein YcbK (DUF882 family)